MRATLFAKRKHNNTFKTFKKRKYEPRILYPAKLTHLERA